MKGLLQRAKPRTSSIDSNHEQKNSNNIDDVDEVDDGNKNIIFSIIKQLRPGCDLSRITLPTFILERKSMLERITNIIQHPQLLLDAAQTEDHVARFVKVVKWYMSGWHIAPKAVKKPLNPVLGEYFSCYWPQADGSCIYYVSEQTSHHPPKSSYFMEWPEHHILVEGILLPQSRFLGNSAASMMHGVGFLEFADHNEKYRITQPNIYARGILLGSMYIEMGDQAVIECKETGMRISLDFKVKGFISGEYDAIGGKIEHNGKPLYELSGKWNEVMYIKDLSTGTQEVLFDVKQDTPEPPKVRPLDEQGEFESRRLWKKVTDALGKRNHDVATSEKLRIEDAERQKARARQDSGAHFETKLFVPTDTELQYTLFCVDALRELPWEKHREMLQRVMPILPGDPFLEDFEYSARHKKMHVHSPPSRAQSEQPESVHTHYMRTHEYHQNPPAPASETAQNQQLDQQNPQQIADEEGDIFVDALAP